MRLEKILANKKNVENDMKVFSEKINCYLLDEMHGKWRYMYKRYNFDFTDYGIELYIHFNDWHFEYYGNGDLRFCKRHEYDTYDVDKFIKMLDFVKITIMYIEGVILEEDNNE